MKKRDADRATASGQRVADIAVALRRSSGSIEDYFAALKEVYELGFRDGSEITEDELIGVLKEIHNSQNN
jgi:hypothetical protein